jgi:hypothetical protein
LKGVPFWKALVSLPNITVGRKCLSGATILAYVLFLIIGDRVKKFYNIDRWVSSWRPDLLTERSQSSLTPVDRATGVSGRWLKLATLT